MRLMMNKTGWVWLTVAMLAVGCPDDTTDDSNPPAGDDACTTTGSDTSTGDDTSEPQGCVSNTECADFGSPGPCQQSICDKAAGMCRVIGVADGTNCDDGDACTQNDQCSDGTCGGSEKTCDDGNLCTDDSCDAATGECVTKNNSAACNDNDASTCCDTRAAGFCQRVIHSGFRSWSRCRPHNQLLDARSRLQLELQMRTRKVEAGSQHRRSQARPWSALPRSQPNALNGRCVPERRRHCPSKRAAARTSEDCRPPSLQLCHTETARP